MKKIELNPEWILDKLTVRHYADGKGKITITADTVSGSRWIELALDTLSVKYLRYTWGPDLDMEKHFDEALWELKIEDIKVECPNLYDKWKIMDDANAQRMLAAQ